MSVLLQLIMLSVTQGFHVKGRARYSSEIAIQDEMLLKKMACRMDVTVSISSSGIYFLVGFR